MAAMESQAAVPRTTLRWNQFSLRGLFLLTLFLAVLLSILATGRTLQVYEATLMVERRPPSLTLVPPSVVISFYDAVGDVVIELSTSDSVMEAVAQSLRLKGIEKLDYGDVSGHALGRHISVKRISEKSPNLYVITASANDQGISKTIARTYYETWFEMIPKLAPTVKQRYLERARSEFSGSDLERFESEWQDMERSGYFSATPARPLKSDPSSNETLYSAYSCFPSEAAPVRTLKSDPLGYGFGVLYDPHLENLILVRPTNPYWNLCLSIASFWLGLGIIAFGIRHWRHYRAYRFANDSSPQNPTLSFSP